MRTFFIILSILAAILGIIFTVLPLENFAFIPIVAGIIFALLARKSSTENQKKFPKILIIVFSILLIAAVAKKLFIKNEIAIDKEYEERIEKSEEKALEELENLENELEDDLDDIE